MTRTINYNHETVGAHGSDSSISSATPIPVPASANMLMIQAEGQDVRITFDGTTPTASVGFLIPAGATAQYGVDKDLTIQVIETAASATVQWQFWRI